MEGTNDDDLRTGPGHYEDTQMPGARGNAALAGHRNGSGAVFQYIDRLIPCDAVVIETETQWMTYRVLPVATDPAQRRAEADACLTPEVATRIASGDYSQVLGQHIATPDAVEVLSPIPGQEWAPASAEPTAAEPVPLDSLERLLTLTTCHPQFSNAERLIVHAVLAETVSKAGGQLPAALKE